MFGYVRPVKAELKIKDFKGYKALYCALCHSLGDHYGHFSRLFLSYDFVYLAMLLTDESQRPCFARKRCLMSPIRKKCCCTDSQELKLCAGLSVILTYWKIQDSISDEKGFKRLAARFLAVGLSAHIEKRRGNTQRMMRL